MVKQRLVRKVALASAIAVAMLLGPFTQSAPAQTQQQIAEISALSPKDWTDTLDYCEWLLNAQYWIDHSDSEYAKEVFAELNLSAADDAALRSIVADFNKRHDQLMAENYAKLASPEWTPETQAKLIQDLVDATNDAIKLMKTKLSADGASKVDDLVLRSVRHD
jgi:hypothetical protein